MRELRRDKIKIYTSIHTIQEATVAAIRAASPADSMQSEISKFARVQTITREIAVTAAHLEAQVLKKMNKSDLSDEERIGNNRRRKWDCFHIATAVKLHCRWLYSFDERMLNRKTHINLPFVECLLPSPRMVETFPESPPPPTELRARIPNALTRPTGAGITWGVVFSSAASTGTGWAICPVHGKDSPHPPQC